MPIADLAATAVLSSLTAGTWTQLSSVTTPQEHGFDHLDAVWICDYKGTAKTSSEVAAAFPLGLRYGTADFWLRSGTPERLGGNVWRFAAHYEGRISSDKPLSVTFKATQEVFSIASLTALTFSGEPVNVRECTPSVEIGYVQTGGAPPANLVGLAGSPAVSPPVRAGYWGSLSDPRYNFPSGWVFTDIDVDIISGGTVTSGYRPMYIRESWQFFLDKIPA